MSKREEETTRTRPRGCIGIALIVGVVLCGLPSVLAILRLSERLDYTRSSERICENLLNEGLLASRDECVISGSELDYIPGMFPLDVSEDYVRKGMQGFEILRTSTRNEFNSITYDLEPSLRRTFGVAQVTFVFRLGILHSIGYIN